MYRETFSKILCSLIDNSGCKKSALASRLGVSPAAVSQFLHGDTLPTADHLCAIFSILDTPSAVAFKLRRLLDLARLEPRRAANSLYAANLRTMRISKGLTYEQLAGFTGLSALQLHQLELNRNGIIDGRERIAIREFFGCDPEEFSLPDPPDNTATVAEPVNFGVPLISLNDLIDYTPDENLLDFAGQHLRDFLFRDFPEFREPVAVRCETSSLGGTAGCTVELILSTEAPEPIVDLCRYECGEFRLRQRCETEYLTWLTRLNTHLQEEPVFTRPVLEISLRPAPNKKDQNS